MKRASLADNGEESAYALGQGAGNDESPYALAENPEHFIVPHPRQGGGYDHENPYALADDMHQGGRAAGAGAAGGRGGKQAVVQLENPYSLGEDDKEEGLYARSARYKGSKRPTSVASYAAAGAGTDGENVYSLGADAAHVNEEDDTYMCATGGARTVPSTPSPHTSMVGRSAQKSTAKGQRSVKAKRDGGYLHMGIEEEESTDNGNGYGNGEELYDSMDQTWSDDGVDGEELYDVSTLMGRRGSGSGSRGIPFLHRQGSSARHAVKEVDEELYHGDGVMDAPDGEHYDAGTMIPMKDRRTPPPLHPKVQSGGSRSGADAGVASAAAAPAAASASSANPLPAPSTLETSFFDAPTLSSAYPTLRSDSIAADDFGFDLASAYGGFSMPEGLMSLGSEYNSRHPSMFMEGSTFGDVPGLSGLLTFNGQGADGGGGYAFDNPVHAAGFNWGAAGQDGTVNSGGSGVSRGGITRMSRRGSIRLDSVYSPEDLTSFAGLPDVYDSKRASVLESNSYGFDFEF